MILFWAQTSFFSPTELFLPLLFLGSQQKGKSLVKLVGNCYLKVQSNEIGPLFYDRNGLSLPKIVYADGLKNLNPPFKAFNN